MIRQLLFTHHEAKRRAEYVIRQVRKERQSLFLGNNNDGCSCYVYWLGFERSAANWVKVETI